MKKLLLSLFTLSFALQPSFAFAYTVKGAERQSRRSIMKSLQVQQKNRQLERAGAVKLPTVMTPTTYAPVGDYVPTLPEDGYSIGELSAPITVVEFVDYACPYCAKFAQDTFPALKKRYVDTGKVRFVFRNFPISFHPAAGVAAQAVECSRKQSESYALELQAAFFAAVTKNGELTQDDVYKAFQSLKGIDTEKMYYCIDTADTIAQITGDMDDAVKGGVNGVPSFWVLGKKGKAELVQGAIDITAFKRVLDTMLK